MMMIQLMKLFFRDWGLGTGDWERWRDGERISPYHPTHTHILNPQSPIPNPQSIDSVIKNLTPQPPSLEGKGELNSPLLVGEGLGERFF
ncbi:hypothetical protein FACHB389_01095 [Nostoc calcicola FACHB-389]|nr:hypothetical protein FACHB389_01095 [Nostoc calcicola FACHB-389]